MTDTRRSSKDHGQSLPREYCVAVSSTSYAAGIVKTITHAPPPIRPSRGEHSIAATDGMSRAARTAPASRACHASQPGIV
jgi:hypothetical protein